MMSFEESGRSNELLAALPGDVFGDLESTLQPVELKAGDSLYTAGDQLRFAYFPVTAVVSLYSPLQDGVGAEVAVVGREGMVGVGAFMGNGKAMSSAVVQRAGMAWRISARDIAELAQSEESVMQQLLRYTQVLFTTMAQTTACHTHHSLSAQLSSWLLQHLDRQDDDELHITQERIAGMLGVRRESITTAAFHLQQEGVIRYRRGLIEVLSRRELQYHCCECYGVTKNAFEQLRVGRKLGASTIGAL